MSSSTDHRSPITDHRTFLHSIPAVVLAVSLLIGCFVGRFTHENDQSWLSATVPVISILAIFQPSPLALAAAGIIAGITLESLRSSRFGDVPEFEGKELTLKGKVEKKSPYLYGMNVLVVKVSEVWGSKREKVNFHFRVSVPAREEIVQGGVFLVRAVLIGSDFRTLPPAIYGRTVSGGWLKRHKALSPVIQGRERLRQVLDSSGDRLTAGLLGAIALGERWRVNARTRDILQKTGTYHLLAISGVHVGAAIFPFLLLGRLCASISQRTCPRVVSSMSLILSVFAVSYYICITGFSASALRATIYFVLVMSAVLVGRNSSSLISLSWCVLLIVCFSVGQQPDISLVLSALAVTGIVLSGRGLSGRGDGNLLKGLVRMTMGAVIFTLPVTVWLAGGISIVAPVGNIISGIPFGLFLIPSAVLMDWTALFSWIPLEPIIRAWLKAADIVLGSMGYLADLPFSFQRLSPVGCLVASLAAVIGILVWRGKRYRLGVGIVICFSIIAVSGSGQYISEKVNRDDLVIDFPRVGQADAAIIRYNGKTVLIDCGPPGPPGRNSPVARALQKLGIRSIDALFLSHPHPDHVGGLEDIVQIWPIGKIYIPDWRDGGREWERLEGAFDADIKVRLLRYGDEINIASMKLKVLGPETIKGPLKDINMGSLQLLLVVDDFVSLFTGDASWDQVWRSMGMTSSLDLLKVPHHGSKKGFPSADMDDTVISISDNSNLIAVCPSRPPGRRPLPAPEVVRWFEGRGVGFVYTGDNGVKIRYKKSGPADNGSTVVDNLDWF